MFKLDLKTLYYPSAYLINNRGLLDELHSQLGYIVSSTFRNLVSSGREINSKSIGVIIDTSSGPSSYSYQRVIEHVKENRWPFKGIMLLPLNDNEIEFKCFTDDKEYLDAITSDIKTFREERNKAIEASKKEQQEKLEKEFGELNGESINKINESRGERYSAIADESRDGGANVHPTRTRGGGLHPRGVTSGELQIQGSVSLNQPEQTLYYSEENPTQVVRIDTQVDTATTRRTGLGELIQQARQIMGDQSY